MARDQVKTSAITYTGYDYQTLHGIKLLADWIESPSRYERVLFEADKETDAPKGIDDITCIREGGKQDYYQVKFTPNPDKEDNKITWEWLLKKSGKTSRSTSLLQKLYKAIKSVAPDKLGKVVLLTNKPPNSSVETCLYGNRIIFRRIPQDIKEQIETQLGSEEKVQDLFDILTIKHSSKSYKNLENELIERFSKFSNLDGYCRLFNAANNWAKFKGIPSQDGWIRLKDIHKILSVSKPEPISQSFLVPDNYNLPDAYFHDNLVEAITLAAGKLIVLSGAPGCGKSTYLSYLYRDLEKRKIPVIRHHYFLSLDDRTDNRLTPSVVASSLINQMEYKYSKAVQLNDSHDLSVQLSAKLKSCAAYFKEKGVPLIIIVDGLDHVWRDNYKDKAPLDDLFKQLLPAVDNTIIVVGTQPVEDKMLPDRLVQLSPRENWYELPLMNENAIFNYMESQYEEGRFADAPDNQDPIDLLKKSALALHDKTAGYPLQMIYSCEYFAVNNKFPTEWRIKELPECKSHHIETYYKGLWINLSTQQKDILHICCELTQFWPFDLFNKVIASEYPVPDFTGVQHLLYESAAGFCPFHESLVVFVLAEKDHISRIGTILPGLCEWLKNDAPASLRETRLWSCLALAGDTKPLRENTTKSWVVERLAEGYPIDTFINLKKQAEEIAFDGRAFGEAQRHRHLKNRMQNGPEFQIPDISILQQTSLFSAPKSVITEAISASRTYSPQQLASISTALWYREDNELSLGFAKQALSRFRDRLEINSSHSHNRDYSEFASVVKAGALNNILNLDNIIHGGHLDSWPQEAFDSLIFALSASDNFKNLLMINEGVKEYSRKQKVEEALVRMAILQQVDLERFIAANKFLTHGRGALLKCLLACDPSKPKYHTSIQPISAGVYRYDCTEVGFEQYFIETLQILQNAQGSFSWIFPKYEVYDEDISDLYITPINFAETIFNKCLSGQNVTLDFCLALTKDLRLPEVNDFSTRDKINQFFKRWVTLAIDLHIFTTSSCIGIDSLKQATSYEKFNIYLFIEWYSEQGMSLLSNDAIAILNKKIIHAQKQSTFQVYELIENNLSLAVISMIHDDVEQCNAFSKSCWEFVLGYGNHKDPYVFHVLDSIKHIIDVDPSYAKNALKNIAEEVYWISDYTDGDEVHHSQKMLTEYIGKTSIPCLASKYRQEVSDGEWYDAEHTLNEILKRINISNPALTTICKTGLSANCISTLSKREEKENDGFQPSNIAIEFNGGVTTPIDEHTATPPDIEDDKINFKNYRPERHSDLIKNFSYSSYAKPTINEWYDYWCAEGEEESLVEELSPVVLQEKMPEHYRYILDSLFESCRKIFGTNKAFPLAIKAQIEMLGWGD
ncbi:ATP-binding protein [Desulfovibrio sp. JC010]|uniref:dsDNA nuclease domain-containing protein n=1 Tax=Desulfovibrio sp. JC010 TaxID=2593641 RepID=UPI0013D52F7F|nr:ATP-binding protein [Desulfovibrio sp. JC010]NDV25961.1 ATP-binding protein [Desulfovibrio sp. JC010]